MTTGAVETPTSMAAALIDRLVHHCHILNIRGNSYRLRQHSELSAALRRSAAEAGPAKRRPRAQEAGTA